MYMLHVSCRLPVAGSERLILSFPFVAYGLKQHHQLLGTLPQSHTCANTLELPIYAEALILTDSQLAREWADAAEGWAGHTNTSSCSQSKLLHACPTLLARCHRVLEERLMVRTSAIQYFDVLVMLQVKST